MARTWTKLVSLLACSLLGVLVAQAAEAPPQAESAFAADVEQRPRPAPKLLAKPSPRPAARPAKDPDPDPMEEMDKLRQEVQDRVTEVQSEASAREEALKKEANAAIAEVQKQADARLEAEREERRREEQRLQHLIEEAAARAEERERSAPPSVASHLHGLTLYGYVQADYQIRQSSEDQVNPTSGVPLNQDRFLIPRARLGAFFERGVGEGRIEIDGNTINGSALRLVDAEASVRWPGAAQGDPALVKGTLGSFRIPFGFETPQDDRQRFFLERSTASRALFPGQYDLGVAVSGAWQFVRYVVAVQNGQPLDGEKFPALDPNHQKDILGRLGLEHSVRQKVDVRLGVSALRGSGFHQGNLANKSTVQWNDANEDGLLGSATGELVGSPALAAGPSSSFTRFGFGADAALTARLLPLGETALAGEFYLASDLDRGLFVADPNGVIGRSFRELGYYASVTQRLGRFMLGARFDYYNPDQDANKSSKGSPVPTDVSYATLAIAGGVVAPWGRFIIEYDRNWNHLGIGLDGLPANLKDDALIARGEVSF